MARIRTAKQARVCREIAMRDLALRALRREADAARRENDRAREAFTASLRRQGIMDAVLRLNSDTVSGDTGIQPKVPPHEER